MSSAIKACRPQCRYPRVIFEADRNAPAVHQIQSACEASSRGVVKLPAVEFPVVTIKMKVHGGGPGMLLSASRSFAFLTPFFAGLPVVAAVAPNNQEERRNGTRSHGYIGGTCHGLVGL